ncbi:MAG: hypothetical protein ACREP9_03900, partial [Candidatus Dormibacteraceae bacterium]
QQEWPVKCQLNSVTGLRLDNWPRRHVLVNQTAGASRCFVTSRDRRVVGYYMLATGSVQRRDVSSHLTHGIPELIPAVGQKKQGTTTESVVTSSET